MSKKAIYLPGGGARGAYQAGVLKGISEIIRAKKIPVDILSSVSSGSINSALIAAHAEDFTFAVTKLETLWSSLSCGKIFKVSNTALMKSILRNVFSMILHYDVKKGDYLLDTMPLKKLLNDNVDFEKINKNIDNKLLYAYELAATCYDTSESISFYKTANEEKLVQETKHIAYTTTINCNHILASSSIPLFFPTVKIGNFHYGDGSVRLTEPLRSCIKLGADQILVINTNKNLMNEKSSDSALKSISFAKIIGTMLKVLFSDNLDKDIDLVEKINGTLHLITQERKTESSWKPINVLHIYPSVDLSTFTKEAQQTMPLLLRYMMSMLGSKEQSSDLMSFLLFEANYCKKLIEIGFHDALSKTDEIRSFFLN